MTQTCAVPCKAAQELGEGRWMASAGAPQGPRSRSAAPRQQQTHCRGSPASLPGPTQNRTRGRGSSHPTWPHMNVKNVEFSLKSSLQLHKCNQDSTQCEPCPGESQRSSTGPWCTTSHPSSQQGDAPHRQPRILDGSPYGCAPCGRGFSQKQALLHHQQAGCSESLSDILDAKKRPPDCPPGGNSARSDSLDTAGPGCRAVRVCQFCSTTFRTESGLQRHLRTDHAQQGLVTQRECSGTDERKERNSKVKADLNKMHKSKTKLLDCRSCDMVFRSTAKLYMHRKEKHSREKNIIEPRPVIIKRRKVGTYPCQICSKVFLHHLSLRAHYRQHTASSFSAINSQPVGQTKDNASINVKPSKAVGKPVKAGPQRPRIPKVANRVVDRRRLREVPEEDEDDEEEREREFPCPSCAEVFAVQSRLQEHVELHQSSVKRRQCSVCTSEMDTCKWPGSKRQRLYHCVPCQQGFSALDTFLEHCQEHLRVRVEEDSITEGYAHRTRTA